MTDENKIKPFYALGWGNHNIVFLFSIFVFLLSSCDEGNTNFQIAVCRVASSVVSNRILKAGYRDKNNFAPNLMK